jgi:hypothetical protein
MQMPFAQIPSPSAARTVRGVRAASSGEIKFASIQISIFFSSIKTKMRFDPVKGETLSVCFPSPHLPSEPFEPYCVCDGTNFNAQPDT